MIRLSHRSLIAVTVAAALLVGVGPLAAAADSITSVSAGAISWDLSSIQNDASLRITGQGIVMEMDFARGSSPVLTPFDSDGNLLADGYYTWELRVLAQPLTVEERSDFPANERGLSTDPSVTYRSEPLSGGFTVVNGAIADPSLEEVLESGSGSTMQNATAPVMTNVAIADQVILDDLIVDGSICAGQDCVNGESFGFDTIRLKENNLRVRAVDTSSTSSFPSRDWQITFNDSANGGANKFSIDDIDGGRTPFTIEAGAPSHSLYVDDGGRLGLGTSTPVVDIHLKSGNTPTLRLEQDGSSGFTPQTWDVAGNEANFFVRDATNGSTLPFKIFPGAPTNSITIEASTGDVGLGTQTPSEELHIVNTGTGNNAAIRFQTNSGDWIMRTQETGQFQIRENAGGTIPVRIHPGASANLLNVGVETDGSTAATGEVNILGTLAITGSVEVDGVVAHADFVFEPEYNLLPIEENVAFMFDEKHLPSLPKAPEGLTGPVDLVSHQMGILEELEKAHIYIGQLHETIQQLQTSFEEQEARLGQLETAKLQ